MAFLRKFHTDLRMALGSKDHLLQNNVYKRLSLNFRGRYFLKGSSSSKSLPRPRIVQAVPYDAHGVRIVFSDGTKEDFRYVWLRDCCQCPECYDKEHRFRRFDTNCLDLDLRPTAMWVTDKGHLGIKWPAKEDSEHRSVFQSNWLQQYGKALSEDSYAVTRDVSCRPRQILWDRNLMEKHGLPQMTYDCLMSTQEGLKKYLDLFYQYGFVILRDVPLTTEALENVANRIAYIRPTSSGHTTDAKLGPQEVLHPADIGTPLGLHTDLPFREQSPGVLMFHFMQAADPEAVGADAGGQTLLSDGFFSAKYLQDFHPAYYNSLSTVPVKYGYFDSDRNIYYSEYWPVIGVNPRGEVEDIHHCPLSRQPLQMPRDEVLTFYEALVEFGRKLQSSHVPFYLRQGDLLALNNRRILHARTAFDPNRVARYTRLCYLDLDEVLYRYDSILHQERGERQD